MNIWEDRRGDQQKTASTTIQQKATEDARHTAEHDALEMYIEQTRIKTMHRSKTMKTVSSRMETKEMKSTFLLRLRQTDAHEQRVAESWATMKKL